MDRHEIPHLLISLGLGLCVGTAAGFAITRALTEKPPRTRDELLRKAQELNLRALRAPM